MANPFFDPGRDRADKVRELFSAIASRYDLINDIQSFGLHRYWKKRLVKLARPRKGDKALDVCCGTGDIAVALAKRGVEVVGLDFSEAMLAVASFKVQSSKFKVRNSCVATRSRFLFPTKISTLSPWVMACEMLQTGNWV